MLNKTTFLAMLCAIALFSTACVTSLLGDDEGASDVVTDSGESDATDSTDSTDDTTAEPTGEDVALDDLPEVELPEGVTMEEADAMVASAIAGDVPPEVEECVGRQLLGEPTMLVALIAAGDNFVVTDLEFDQQVRLAEITIDCSGPELTGEFLAQGFADGAGQAASPEMEACFANRFSQPDGALVMAGLFAVGENVPPDPSAQGPLVDTLTECIPGSFLADSVTAELAADPALAGAVDQNCIDTAFDNQPDALRPMWEAFVVTPDADFEDLPPSVTQAIATPLVSCLSFGRIVADQAAADGVTISQPSIDCIDENLAGSGLIEAVIAGQEPDDAALGAVFLSCLTPDELSQLGGL